jgi:hypothetical protein
MTNASATQPTWESAVEAEINRLAAEVERLSHEVLKQGGRFNDLYRERAERQRHAKRRRPTLRQRSASPRRSSGAAPS